MYMEAMEEISADITPINTFLDQLSAQKNILLHIENSKLMTRLRTF